MPILKVSIESAATQNPIDIIYMHVKTKFKEMQIRIIVNEVLSSYLTYTLFKRSHTVQDDYLNDCSFKREMFHPIFNDSCLLLSSRDDQILVWLSTYVV